MSEKTISDLFSSNLLVWQENMLEEMHKFVFQMKMFGVPAEGISLPLYTSDIEETTERIQWISTELISRVNNDFDLNLRLDETPINEENQYWVKIFK